MEVPNTEEIIMMVDSEVQFAVYIMSLTVTPRLVAADVEAALVELDLKIDMSMPLACIIFLIHL